MRVLGVLRLSQESESSVSIRKQREIINAWAKANDHTVIAWCEDSGVSGSVDPFERDQLGPWLDEGKAAEYDAIVAQKVDRVSRRLVHFAKLTDWLDQRGKAIICVSDGIDTSTSVGKLVAQILSMFAEFELRTITERIIGTKKQLRTTTRFTGGKVPFGYWPVPLDASNPRGGKVLAIDPVSAAVVAQMVERVLAGDSVASIRRDLTCPAPIDYARTMRGEAAEGVEWSTRAILTILRSPTLLGQKVHNGRAVRGQDGMPLQQAQPLVTQDTWGRLQKALDTASRPQVYSNPTSLLADVVRCASCGGKLYLQTQRQRGHVYRTYRCSNRNNGKVCDAPAAMKADQLEDVVTASFYESPGPNDRLIKVWVPGEDHSEELAQVQVAIDQLREEQDLGLYDGDRAGYLSRLQRLTARRKQLEQLPNRPGGWVYQATGETYRQAWDRMDTQERRQLLLDADVCALVSADAVRMIG